MTMIDWSRPLEAVHEDGRVEPVALNRKEPCNPDEQGDYYTVERFEGFAGIWRPDGSSWQGFNGGWRIRNVQPANPSPDPKLYQEMVELVERVAAGERSTPGYPKLAEDAGDLLKRLRPEDPDEAAAREIYCEFVDDETALPAIRAAIARGRSLASQERQA